MNCSISRSNQNARRPAKTRRRYRLDLEVLESRVLLSATLYAPDGTGNNVANPPWGSAGTDLLRLLPAAYADGISSPSLANNPSARVVSDLLNNQADPATRRRTSTPSIRTACPTSATPGASSSTTTWTSRRPTRANCSRSWPTPTTRARWATRPSSAPSFDPTTGTSTSNPRQQVNAVTSFLDLSQVYGSTAAMADALRTHAGGR